MNVDNLLHKFYALVKRELRVLSMNVILARVPHREDPIMNEARQVEMEQAVVEFLDQRRKELGMTVEEWAVQVYPGISSKSARMRIQNIRKPQAVNGKRKRLLYSEFVLMARALKIPASEVVTITSLSFPELKEQI